MATDRSPVAMSDRIPAPLFFSYCPSTDTTPGTRRDAIAPCRSLIQRVRKAGRKASRLSRVSPLKYYQCGMRKPVAVALILRFSCRMSGADKTGSKLSASMTRQSGRRPSAVSLIELGKGGDPPLHPPCRLWRHAETVPVSAPFGFCIVAPPSLCEVHR